MPSPPVPRVPNPRRPTGYDRILRGRRLGGHLAIAAAALLVAPLWLTGCSLGDKPRGDASQPRSGSGCTAKPGDQLVLLGDDRKSQNSDNVVPVVKSTAAKPPLTAGLEAVSR